MPRHDLIELLTRGGYDGFQQVLPSGYVNLIRETAGDQPGSQGHDDHDRPGKDNGAVQTKGAQLPVNEYIRADMHGFLLAHTTDFAGQNDPYDEKGPQGDKEGPEIRP